MTYPATHIQKPLQSVEQGAESVAKVKPACHLNDRQAVILIEVNGRCSSHDSWAI